MTLFDLATALAAVIWLIVLLLPWQPWRTRERFTANPAAQRSLADVTVLIPARNEADMLANTLAALKRQGNGGLHVIVIDDQSTDDTAEMARQSGIHNLQILQAPPLPAGWSGKLWALEQGHQQVGTPYTLLLDADIELRPGVIAGLLNKLERDNLQLVSLMAKLRMQSGWEKLLMPAFIYFFKLLYPFALANRPQSRVAAAAGGCVLVRSEALQTIGGPAGLRDALIDDCALARRIKQQGGRTWLGLSLDVISQRRYQSLTSIWEMVTRTAYTQLAYSPWLLAACIILLTESYLVPVAGLFMSAPGCWFALTALAGILISYRPTIRYYGLQPWRVVTLPVAALLFGLMTLDSARRHLLGRGAKWKDRHYSEPQIK